MATRMELETLLVKLVADASQYTAAMQKAMGQTQRVGEAMQKMGRRATAVVTGPLAAIGAISVKAFGDFDQAMTESTSIMQVTESQIARMRVEARRLGTQGAKGPAELARSYFFLASAGLDAEQSLKALPAVTKFATAGAFDMSRATDLLTDAQSALGLSVDDAVQNQKNMIALSDALVGANTLANASVEQFSIALTSKAGAAAKSFTRSQEEVIAVLAAMADQGIKAELAGNAYDRILRLLSKSSRDNAKEHKELGFSVFDATGRMRNMADIMGQLETITAGMSDETKSATLEMLGFEARVQGVILPLLGTSKAIEEYQGKLEDMQGITNDVAEKQLKSFNNQMKILKNNVTDVAIEIGEILAPDVLKLNDLIRDGLDHWRGLNDETKAFAVQAAKITAAVGPVLLMVGTITVGASKASSMLAFLAGGVAKLVALNPPLAAIIGVILGIAAAITGVIFLLNKFPIQDVLDRWGKTFLRFIETLPHNFGVAIETISRMFFAFLGWLTRQFITAWDFVSSAEFARAVVAGINEGMILYNRFVKAVAELFFTTWEAIGTAFVEVIAKSLTLAVKVATGIIDPREALAQISAQAITSAQAAAQKVAKKFDAIGEFAADNFMDGFQADTLGGVIGDIWEEQRSKFKPFMDDVDELKETPLEFAGAWDEVTKSIDRSAEAAAALAGSTAAVADNANKAAGAMAGTVEGQAVSSASVQRALFLRNQNMAAAAQVSKEDQVQTDQLKTLQSIDESLKNDAAIDITLEEAGFQSAFNF